MDLGPIAPRRKPETVELPKSCLAPAWSIGPKWTPLLGSADAHLLTGALFGLKTGSTFPHNALGESDTFAVPSSPWCSDSMLLDRDPAHAFMPYPAVPVANAPSGPLVGPDLRRQGPVRRRGLSHRLRLAADARHVRDQDADGSDRAEAPRCRRPPRRQDDHRRARLFHERQERPFRHPGERRRARPDPGRLVRRARRRPSRTGCATLRSAPIRAARSARRRAIAASSASARPMAGSAWSSATIWRRPSTPAATSPATAPPSCGSARCCWGRTARPCRRIPGCCWRRMPSPCSMGMCGTPSRRPFAGRRPFSGRLRRSMWPWRASRRSTGPCATSRAARPGSSTGR